MELVGKHQITVLDKKITSIALNREVTLSCFIPLFDKSGPLHLLLLNDGQDMERMGYARILSEMYAKQVIPPVYTIAIHASQDRKLEYGVASQADYLGRGAKAGLYMQFIIEELMPFINQQYQLSSFASIVYGGFSLGGLSALDIAWRYPLYFNVAGVFSGALWWRSLDQDDPTYDDHEHRIMHQVIKTGTYNPGQKFYFEVGCLDETNDRNNNGIIDAIDDVVDMIDVLVKKGYNKEKDIRYLELADGKHDVETWGRAMPDFLQWAFS